MNRNTRGWTVVTSYHLSSGANLCIEARLALQHAQNADSNQPGDCSEDRHCEQRIHHQAAAWHRARKRNERQANITLKENHHGLQHVRSRRRDTCFLASTHRWNPTLRSGRPSPLWGFDAATRCKNRFLWRIAQACGWSHLLGCGWQSDLPSLRSGATPGQSPS